ncbi:MAG TPA: isoleucine--tRNA ligase [Candidatus Saccharimonadales bacterium]|nr:isoleucine--tRNA ligase [Candidatus Saccharimonadales bacterium]
MKKAEPADFPKFEAEMLKVWDREKTFEASLKQRENAPYFSFYDGPPFANGLPHFGHSLVTSIKDAIGRYRAMRGYYVERRNGWDTHGLPVEFAIEKEFGVSGKKQILNLGIDRFNQACRNSVFAYKHDWEDFFLRIGRWTDTENAYATINPSYTESVWWVLGQVHEKGLLYKGYKSMPYCPRCETPISNFELNEGYKDDVPDPSVFVTFPLEDDPKTMLLAWTTTPWTLPANAALAVDEKADYVTVELSSDGDAWKAGERLIFAKDRLEVLDLRKAKYSVVETRKGKELLGLRYRPLYEFVPVEGTEREAAWRVYHDDTVSLEDGSGMLHVAPRYGETDLALGQRAGLPLILSADASGRMTESMGEFAGIFFKEADPEIIADLTKKGRIFSAETFRHIYPFCYRCDSPLLYFAIDSWYVRVSAIRNQLLETAEQIEWIPAHIKHGRFGKWLEGARDWAISRNRFWGAPLPIWVNEDDETDYIVVSSFEQLRELAGEETDLSDVHRPYIDTIVIHKDSKTYKRVEEVFDCWFESGSMPVAQQHYPFDNKEKFEQTFPADYIGEGLDQTRLWFYVQHVLATIVFNKPAYKHVLVNGMVMAADGQKLSKRLRNYPPVEEVFAEEGADMLRFYLLSNDQALGADYMRFNRDAMIDLKRNVFMTLWNVYSFFSTYAEIDGWQPGGGASNVTSLVEPSSDNILDQWLINIVNKTTIEVTKQADSYQIARAVRPLRELIDDLSNWYVRRSRRRFSRNDNADDKQAAYATLHFALVRISQLLAPWSPFISDKLYRELTTGMNVPPSVHLTDWPSAGQIDNDLLAQVQLVRTVVSEGLAQRAAAGIKVRQPLSEAVIASPTRLPDSLAGLAAEELNVKKIVQKDASEVAVKLNTDITQSLKQEGLARDIIRQIQQQRKQAGLRADDWIRLELGVVGGELKAVIDRHGDLIKDETLARELKLGPADGQARVPVKVAGEDLIIQIDKVG